MGYVNNLKHWIVIHPVDNAIHLLKRTGAWTRLPRYSNYHGVFCHLKHNEIMVDFLDYYFSSDMQSCMFSGNLNSLLK